MIYIQQAMVHGIIIFCQITSANGTEVTEIKLMIVLMALVGHGLTLIYFKGKE